MELVALKATSTGVFRDKRVVIYKRDFFLCSTIFYVVRDVEILRDILLFRQSI